MYKNKKPLIGITTQEDPNPHAWAATMYGQNHQYSDAVLAGGGIPVLLPFTHTVSELRDAYEALDGILFAGGGDVSPAEYGEEDGQILKDVSPERDRIELQLIKWAIADDKPVLAICRGLQIMNVALGGTLIQDISTEFPEAQDHDISTIKKDRHYIAHHLIIEPNSRLASILGDDTIDANSHHHQAIKKPAPGLSVSGRAEDGIIESIELARSRFVLGIQCHPESLFSLDSGWRKLFISFVESARMDYSLPAKIRKSSKTETVEAL